MAFQTITQLFLEATSKYADKYMYFSKRRENWEGLRGKDIRHSVEDLAFGLVSFGLKKGVQGAILSNNSPRWAMADYAILATGGATVAIYPTLLPQQGSFILNNSESRIVFVEDEIQAQKIFSVWPECPKLKYMIILNDDKVATKPPEGCQVVSFFDLLESGHQYGKDNNLDFEQMCNACSPDDLLTLIYTSGTTGEPKGVMLTHNNLVTNIGAALTHITVDETDSLLCFLPLSHSFERMAGHFLGFSRGATTYYAESIEKVAENLRETHPTVLIGAPRFYEKVYNKVIESISSAPAVRQRIFWWSMAQGKAVLAHRMNETKPGALLSFKHKIAQKLVFTKLKGRVGGKIKFFISGSAPLAADIAEFFAMMGMVILEGYGLTETSPALTLNKLEKFKFGKVGPALPNIELKIAGDGEILARGPSIMKGYFNNPEATAEAIDSDGWFYTGDIGELDEDGFLSITDRKKAILVTSGGKNIAPAPLENALITSPWIEQVVILGDKRNFVSAMIVPSFEKLGNWAEENKIADRDPAALIKNAEIISIIEGEVEGCMEPFARYERIRKIALLPRELTIDEDELTPTMKVKRRVVLKHFADVVETIYAGAIAEAQTK